MRTTVPSEQSFMHILKCTMAYTLYIIYTYMHYMTTKDQPIKLLVL